MTVADAAGKESDKGWRSLLAALSRPIIILLALQMMGGMILSPHRTFFPIYLQDLGSPVMLIAVLSTLNRLMGLIAALLGGTLSDSIGRKWTLLLGEVGFLLGAMVFLTPSTWLIAVLWATGGMGMGLSTLGGQSYFIDAAAPTHLSLLAAFYNWGYTVGGALSSPVAGFILDRWGYRAFGFALGALALTAIITNLVSLPRIKRSGEGHSIPHSKLFGYGEVVRQPTAWLLAVLRFLPTVYWGMALVFIPLLLADAGASKTLMAWYATVSQITASLSQAVVGRIADHWGGKWPTVGAYAVLVLAVAFTGILADRLWGIFAFGTVGAAAAWSLSTLLPGMVARATSSQERGRVLGWIHLWWNLGMIVGSLVGGALFERWMGLPFILAGVLNVVSIALALIFFRLTTPGVSSESP